MIRNGRDVAGGYWMQRLCMPAMLTYVRVAMVGCAAIVGLAGFVLFATLLAFLPFLCLGGLSLMVTGVLVFSLATLLTLGCVLYFFPRRRPPRISKDYRTLYPDVPKLSKPLSSGHQTKSKEFNKFQDAYQKAYNPSLALQDTLKPNAKAG